MSAALSGGTPTEEKLLSTLGLCARARKLVTGTPMVCEALRAGGKTPVLAVLEAEDTSAATHEKLVSKCTYYRTPHYRIPVNTGRLAHAVGKTGAVAAVGVTDENLLRALSRYLPESTPSQSEAQE
jgi:ribosomal protein L7Ae-like RNA K-turn-binding protein